MSKKEELERKTNECEQRLVRAGKLIGGLADEKERWQSSVAVSQVKSPTQKKNSRSYTHIHTTHTQWLARGLLH